MSALPLLAILLCQLETAPSFEFTVSYEYVVFEDLIPVLCDISLICSYQYCTFTLGCQLAFSFRNFSYRNSLIHCC